MKWWVGGQERSILIDRWVTLMNLFVYSYSLSFILFAIRCVSAENAKETKLVCCATVRFIVDSVQGSSLQVSAKWLFTLCATWCVRIRWVMLRCRVTELHPELCQAVTFFFSSQSSRGTVRDYGASPWQGILWRDPNFKRHPEGIFPIEQDNGRED